MDYKFTMSTAVNPANLAAIVVDKNYLEARRAGLEIFFRADSTLISYKSTLGKMVLDLSSAELAPLWKLWKENRRWALEQCQELHFEKERILELPEYLAVDTDLTMIRGDWGFLGFMAMMIPREIEIQISEKWYLTPGGIFSGKRQIRAVGLPVCIEQNWEYQKKIDKGYQVQIQIQIADIPFASSHLDTQMLTTMGYNLLKLEEEWKTQWWELKFSALSDNKA